MCQQLDCISIVCLQPESAPLEGLAKSGSQACLAALHDCLPSRLRLPRPMSGLTPVQHAPPAHRLGSPAMNLRMSALLEQRRSTPSAQGAADATRRQETAGPCSEAMSEGTQPERGAPGRATGSCSPGSAGDVANPTQNPVPPNTGPGERLQRPAWLEAAAQRISQGIHLGIRAPCKRPSSPGVSFPESLPAAFAALGVVQRSAA